MNRDKTEVRLFDIPAFQTLMPHTIKAIQSVATLCRMQDGEILCHQGSASHSFYIVQEGSMKLVRYTPDGKAVILKVYSQGDLFGLLAISSSFQHHANIESMGDSEVIGIHGKDSRELMLAYPEFSLLVIDWLANHVQHAHDRIRSLSTERTERRLARALIHFHNKFGHTDSEGVLMITTPLSQQDMAEFTGTTVESVNRHWRSWQKQGYITYSRNEICIQDYASIYHLAHEGEEDDVYLDMR